MGKKLLTVELVTEESRARESLAAIEASGGTVHGAARPWDVPADLIEDYSDAQFEPLTIVAAAVSAAFLIKRISDVWLDHNRPGGQVVDARRGKLVVRVAPHLERGTLVVLTDQGKEVYSPDRSDAAAAVLEKLFAGRG